MCRIHISSFKKRPWRPYENDSSCFGSAVRRFTYGMQRQACLQRSYHQQHRSLLLWHVLRSLIFTGNEAGQHSASCCQSFLKSAFLLPVSLTPFDFRPKLPLRWSSEPAIPSLSVTIFKKSFLASCFQILRRQSYPLLWVILCVLAFCVWCRSPIPFWTNQLSFITLKMIYCWQASPFESRWETHTMK